MSRVARVVVAGFPHHVTQRGNRRCDVFETDFDRESYLRFLKQYAERHGLAVWAYCLMSNHIHLVAVPAREESLGLSLRDTHTVYAMYFNTRTQQTGHVWQGRFHSCPLDEVHSWAAVRYVERNPVRAGLVQHAEEYPWSSAAAHCGLRRANTAVSILSNDFPPSGVINDWKQWLSAPGDDAYMNIVRAHTHTGRPCGSPAFLDHLENLMQRTLRPHKRGRKLKPKEHKELNSPRTA